MQKSHPGPMQRSNVDQLDESSSDLGTSCAAEVRRIHWPGWSAAGPDRPAPLRRTPAPTYPNRGAAPRIR